jgi:citrate synthase
MEPWHTGIVDASEGHIRFHGYDVTTLMTNATFTDTIFLLHRGELPSPGERALMDAILIGCADHGPGAPSCATARLAASGNRESLAAAVAAGLLAVGNDHGGAGAAAMEMIAAGLARVREESISIEASARACVTEARAAGRRLPGLGHRVHKVDPRTALLFAMARDKGLASDGIRFMEALDATLREQGKTLPVNIDGALAAVLHDLGFPPAFGKLVFLIARVAGLTAEVAEEYAREKPMRIRVPVEYDGRPARQMPPKPDARSPEPGA